MELGSVRLLGNSGGLGLEAKGAAEFGQKSGPHEHLGGGSLGRDGGDVQVMLILAWWLMATLVLQ
jgi:hypothetical protein